MPSNKILLIIFFFVLAGLIGGIAYLSSRSNTKKLPATPINMFQQPSSGTIDNQQLEKDNQELDQQIQQLENELNSIDQGLNDQQPSLD